MVFLTHLRSKSLDTDLPGGGKTRHDYSELRPWLFHNRRARSEHFEHRHLDGPQTTDAPLYRSRNEPCPRHRLRRTPRNRNDRNRRHLRRQPKHVRRSQLGRTRTPTANLERHITSPRRPIPKRVFGPFQYSPFRTRTTSPSAVNRESSHSTARREPGNADAARNDRGTAPANRSRITSAVLMRAKRNDLLVEKMGEAEAEPSMNGVGLLPEFPDDPVSRAVRESWLPNGVTPADPEWVGLGK